MATDGRCVGGVGHDGCAKRIQAGRVLVFEKSAE